MLNLWERLKEYLGLSSKATHDVNVSKNQNKSNDDGLIKTENIIFKSEEEVKDMINFDEALSKPYDEVAPSAIMGGEKGVGEYLVDTGTVSANGEAIYTGIRVDITAIFKTTDEYNYDKYFRIASFSDVYIEDLSTINFGTQNDSYKEALARIRRVLSMPRYTRTKLMYVNMLEVDSTGAPYGVNSVKIPVLDFMKKYKIHIF